MSRASGQEDHRDEGAIARFTSAEQREVPSVADDAGSPFSGAIGVIAVKGCFGRRGEVVYTEVLLQKHRR